ncbi:lysophospholipid acyltransferase family protein [Halochromatium roseum]|uniref:lysophospholipid acyltransferase family protein n=1 Tax=Halochromatium roseum TaxID=391920 RepID=UPI00191165DC|nr:lysophospholipid acyltransferase family protein [Halochromatium roseum]MBK5940074.1 lipid A biosynthesis acyltransferase [Halochromatium roseum]
MTERLWTPGHWPSWALVGLFKLLALLPFRLQARLGQGLGWIGYQLAWDRRRVARINLSICLPELEPWEREQLVREHFGWLGLAAVCQGLSWSASPRRLARIVRLRHRERIDTYLEAGRPVIVLVPHFVGLELGGTAFTALVHSGIYMYQRIRDPVIDAQVRHARTRFGAIPVERQDDLRGLIRTLKSGVPFFYLPDQDPGRRRGVFVSFCGVPAATVPTLGRIARLAGAVVIPTFARFLPRGEGLELCFDPPIADFPSGDAEVDTARMNQVIEARLRTMPAQYFWVHRRFKTRPEGAEPIYPVRRRQRR